MNYRYHPWRILPASLVLLALLACSADPGTSREPAADAAPDAEAPNILLIVLDDVGFGDLGVFGGEINTPNIDALARGGVTLSNFHAAPTCSPTRAMLLTGVDNHIAGLGTMHGDQTPNQKGKPGYEAYLNNRVAALPEILSDAGYRTYMTGKWHLGLTPETGPFARGFDRSFSLLEGGAGAFSNMLPLFGPGKAKYAEDGKPVEQLPQDFYSTRFYTERMMQYLQEDRDDERPFFAYLSYTAPHWPLQAPREAIDRYRGNYDAGYDALRTARLARQKELGLVKEDVVAFPRLLDQPAWKSLSSGEQAYQARLMEIYAAMVDDVDRYLGKLLDYLKSSGQFDNTLIFIMSDNGPEGNDLSFFGEWVETCCDNSFENIGNADSYVWLGPNWAQAGSVPHRMYKSFTGQGGIRVPAFFHYTGKNGQGFDAGKRNANLTHVMDVMPTVLELAGAEWPQGEFRGRPVAAVQGRSLLPLLRGQADELEEKQRVFAWELFGRRALREGDWKIVYLPYYEPRTRTIPLVTVDTWQLYNLADDPAETRDLAASNPEKLQHLLSLWQDYVEQNGVILPDEPVAY